MPATVVLVHGAWHGAWCWDRVVEGLTARGVDTVAIDLPGHGASRLPLGDLHGDAALLGQALDGLDGSDAIVCGHSYGGAVITEGAAGHPNVRHLVYLAALMLDVGESCSRSIPDPPDGAPAAGSELGPAMQVAEDGTTTVDPILGRGIFYADCSDADIDWATARLGPHPAITLTQPVPVAAWRDMPSTYVVCADDRAIAPWMQEIFAERATNTVVWPTSHSPFLSQPELVVDLLARLAAG